MLLRRAFTPALPVSDIRMFSGREQLLLKLIRAVEEQQVHVIVYGDRGVGKTSALHVFGHLAREARYIVRYVSCSETSSFEETMRTIAAAIPLLYHADFEPTSDAAQGERTFADLLADKPISVATMSDLFEKITGTRMILVLDEFDRVESGDFRRSVAQIIKALSDRAVPLQLIIAGVAGNLTELIEQIPSIRRNVVGLPVTAMSRAEIDEILSTGEGVSGLSFRPAARDRIATLAIGSPYLASLLGQQSGFVTVDRGATDVEASDVDKAVEQISSDMEQRLSPRAHAFAEQVIARGQDGWITLARESLTQFGLIRRGERSTPFIDEGKSAGILEPTEVLDEAGYRFVDDGLAIHLWLAAHRRG